MKIFRFKSLLGAPSCPLWLVLANDPLVLFTIVYEYKTLQRMGDVWTEVSGSTLPLDRRGRLAYVS
jgi:hypothetical protein